MSAGKTGRPLHVVAVGVRDDNGANGHGIDAEGLESPHCLPVTQADVDEQADLAVRQQRGVAAASASQDRELDGDGRVSAKT